MNRRTPKKAAKLALTYLFLILVAVLMVYPLLFMFFGAFKGHSELFSSISLWPKNGFSMEAFIEGWKGSGQYTYGTFFVNTFKLVLPCVVFTLVSSTLVAYGFARFQFRFHNVLFITMLSTLMLPQTVVIIPRYILFNHFRWLDSYLPFIIPTLFAINPFFIFMLVQFLRGIPRDLDESACIDGCGTFQILIRILCPLLKPAFFSVGIFEFIWTWNNFFNALIYINSVSKFPVSLALKMSVDSVSGIQWNRVMAMSFLAVLPSIIIFFLAQKYFVEGISTTGLKG